MWGQILNKLLGSGKSLLVGVGIYTTVRYFWDDSLSLYESRIKKQRILEVEGINNTVLTPDDIVYYTKKYGVMSEYDMKTLKYNQTDLVKRLDYKKAKLNVDEIYRNQQLEDDKWKRKRD